jgi:hypothetical protein
MQRRPRLRALAGPSHSAIIAAGGGFPVGRAEVVLGSIFALGCLLFSTVYSYQAPGGIWMNQIFGEGVWNESDPSAFYVAAAHELRPDREPGFVGHPGTTLLLLLSGVQRSVFALGPSEGFTFTGFTARNLPSVFLASKLVMTVLHLASFFLAYVFAGAILRNRRAAFFAALGYATSFPVLYYLSRISVEPIMMLCLLGAFLATWKFQDLAKQGRVRLAIAFAALAGVCAGSGVVTKLNFMAPLPFFLALYLLVGEWRVGAADPVRWRTRGVAAGVFAVVCIATIELYTQQINWNTFFSIWGFVSRAAGVSASWSARDFLPSLEPDGILLASELLFVAMAAVGGVLWLRRGLAELPRALWALAYAGWGLLLWAYRAWLAGDFLPFHYFILPSLFLAVFFGYFTDRVARRFAIEPGGWRAAGFALVWFAVIHGMGAWAVVDSRRADARMFAARRPVYDLLADLEPEQRLGVELRPRENLAARIRRIQFVPAALLPSSKVPALRAAFDSSFEAVRPELVGENGIFVPLLARAVVVLEGTER